MEAPPVGTRVSREFTLDEDAIRAGARLAGDVNPLHHDAAFAAASRFGGLIASGAHMAALLAGLVTRLVQDSTTPAVGVDFQVRFRAPVRPGRRMRMEWVITGTEPARTGISATLEGRMEDLEDGTVALTGAMRCLFLKDEADGAARAPRPGGRA